MRRMRGQCRPQRLFEDGAFLNGCSHHQNILPALYTGDRLATSTYEQQRDRKCKKQRYVLSSTYISDVLSLSLLLFSRTPLSLLLLVLCIRFQFK